MKKIAILPLFALVALLLNSCCATCFKKSSFSHSGCSLCGGSNYVEKEVVEWVEEEVYVDSGAKGGPGSTVMQRRPVVKTVKVRVECGDCGTYWCPEKGCCGTLSDAVYSRVTTQGGTGEPHIGLVPTMRVLAE